jgi:pimeloyl-ACP methyl ester carboxylesterase
MTTVKTDGVTLGVESFGDAEAPLVLLAGGTTMMSWPDALCEATARGGRHVVRYDLRDSGASTTIDPEAPAYTLRPQADRRRSAVQFQRERRQGHGRFHVPSEPSARGSASSGFARPSWEVEDLPDGGDTVKNGDDLCLHCRQLAARSAENSPAADSCCQRVDLIARIGRRPHC